MKKTLLVALMALLVLIVVPASAGVPSEGWGFAYVDLGMGNLSGDSVWGTNGSCWSFNDQFWGGAWDEGAVTTKGGDPDPAGYCDFSWSTKDKARRVRVQVLDSTTPENTFLDDSFEVYASGSYMGAKRGWILVYSYTDETDVGEGSTGWFFHDITRFPSRKGRTPKLYIKIVPTNPDLTYYDNGLLCVDYVSLYTTR